MKIGFDGKRASQNFTGLGNYSRYIVDILCRYYPQNEYVLYTPKKRNNQVLDRMLAQYRQLKVSLPIPLYWKKASAIWRIWGITKQLQQENISVFHGLSNELPLNIRRNREVKSIVTIHDLIFLRYPQYYPFIDRLIYTYKFRKACRNADVIIAISECTQRDIVTFFKIPETKICIVYQGCDSVFAIPATENKKLEVQEKYKLPPRYILNVGSIEKRKNILLAVRALKAQPQDVHLIIVGRRTSYTKEIENYIQANGLGDRVHILSNVPFADLPSIYQLAEIFVYPSRFEGFGIPIIEAIHSGIPVIAATGSCLEEAGGPDSIYVHPDDENALATAFEYLLSHPEIRENKVKKSREYIRKFSENQQAQVLIDIYNRLAL